MTAGSQFVTYSGAVATSTTAKTVLSLIAGASSAPTVIGLDFSSDSTVTTGSFLLELVRFTTDGTGTAATPFKLGGMSTLISTSKSNYTVEPTTATVVNAWFLPATQPWSYLWPLGRELTVAVSGLLAVRVTAPSGTPNVRAALSFEE